MNYQIREMNHEDWESVSKIYQSGMDTNMSTFEMKCPTYDVFDASHASNCRFVILANDTIVGWAVLSPTSSRHVYRGVAEVSIYIDEMYQNKGVGTRLLKELIIQSEQNGYWTLRSGIFQDNHSSIKLHEKCGFRMVGFYEKIGKDRYGQWRNTVVMERRSTVEGLN